MRTGFMIVALAVVLALSACTRRIEPPAPPTPEEQARNTHATIVNPANTLLRGDRLGYDASDDEVERVKTTCAGDRCAVGFVSLFTASGESVEEADLTLLRERRGVTLVRTEQALGYGDSEAWGGWFEYSLFATQRILYAGENEPDDGVTTITSTSLGFSSGQNPSAAGGSARWEGLMLGRDMRASPARGQVIRGDADVTVDFAADGATAAVEFTGIVNIESGDLQGSMGWSGMPLDKGAFARRNTPDDTITGQFYGPGEEEVGGVFERDGIAGAFGGRRTSAP